MSLGPLTPRSRLIWPQLLMIVGIIAFVGIGVAGYLESRRTETILVAARSIPNGQQITADDLSTIEVPRVRPAVLAGIQAANAVIGRWSTRTIGIADVLKPDMLADAPPTDPTFPNGTVLPRNYVAVGFAMNAIGPVTERDAINIGFITTDATLCDRTAADVPPTQLLPPPPAPIDGTAPIGRAVACRWMSEVPILYLDTNAQIAYLQMDPTKAHAMWALTAAGVKFWGERTSRAAAPLAVMDRLDAAQVRVFELTDPISATIRLEPRLTGTISGTQTLSPTQSLLPGANAAPIPGTNAAPIPGSGVVNATAPISATTGITTTTTPARGGKP